MEQFLKELNNGHSDATTYVQAHGVTKATISSLRASLLE